MHKKNTETLQTIVAEYLSEYWLQGNTDRPTFNHAYGIRFEDTCIDLYSIYYDDQGYFDHLKYSPEEPLSAVKLVVEQCNHYMKDSFKDEVYASIR